MCRNKRFSFKTISVHLVFSVHWIPDNTHIHTHMLPSPHTHVSCRNINGGGASILNKENIFQKFRNEYSKERTIST